MTFGSAEVAGDDATSQILNMYLSLNRDDIACIMLGGLVISMYNIVDGEKIYNETRVPVVAITREDSSGLEESIKGRFPNWKEKLALYAKLGAREKVELSTGKSLFIQCWGLNQRKAISVLNSFTLQGSIPEPIRIAKLAARAFSSAML